MPSHQLQHFKRELENRKQKSSESVKDYKEVVHDLVMRVFPNSSPAEAEAEILYRMREGVRAEIQDLICRDEFI